MCWVVTDQNPYCLILARETKKSFRERERERKRAQVISLFSESKYTIPHTYMSQRIYYSRIRTCTTIVKLYIFFTVLKDERIEKSSSCGGDAVG